MDKKPKTFFKFFLLILLILLLLMLAWFFVFHKLIKSSSSSENQNPAKIIENPMKNIVMKNTKDNKTNQEEITKQGIAEFNEDYINYLLLAINVNNLHESNLGYGTPIVELKMDGETWNSEITKAGLKTQKGPNENKDVIIYITKEEAVKALLSHDIKEFMKNSVISGNTKIEPVVGKVELFSKGYLDLYNELSK